MKKVLTLILICLVFNTGVIMAQKIGHINSNDLLLAMPERANIETEIQSVAKQLENQLLTMQRELETKFQEFQAKESLMTESIREDKIKELNGLEQRLKEFQQNAQSDLQKKEQALTDPLIKKAKDAIEAVGKENGFTYILDSGIGFILYMDETTAVDIMPMVKTKLGLELE
ncbi:MAG: OmpH family outer membrane protein [Vicingaceae bacterium]